jgi:hypothetical protein
MQNGGYFACPASVGGAEPDRRGPARSHDAGFQSAAVPGAPAPGRADPNPGLRAGTERECLAPAHPERYGRPMDISPNRGNIPCFRVQVPPRT